MKLQYQTGTATFIQLAVMTLLITIGGVRDVAKNCDTSTECVANSFIWLVIAFFIAGWFAALFALGWFAQDKRSYKFARILITAELFTAFISFMLLRNPSSTYSTVGAAISLALALWVCLLGWRIYRIRDQRVTARTMAAARPRRRPVHRKKTDAN